MRALEAHRRDHAHQRGLLIHTDADAKIEQPGIHRDQCLIARDLVDLERVAPSRSAEPGVEEVASPQRPGHRAGERAEREQVPGPRGRIGDHDLALPAGLKKALANWRVGLSTVIDDKEVQVVQGSTARGGTATLYFDAETGLLVRHVRYNDSPVGRISRQTDYSDYREVAGVKMPFKWTDTWLDGRDVVELTDVQPNANIDAAKFAKPAAPVAK